MKIKILNSLVELLLKALLKIYTPDMQPRAIETNIGSVLHNFPKDGGMESWIPGHDFPFPGMPDDKVVETLNIVKRMYPVFHKWAWVILRDRLPNYLIPQSQNGEIGLVDPKKYSKAVREIHKSHTFIRSCEGDNEMRGKWTEKRDVECLYYEFDDTYRFREMLRIITMDWSQFLFTDADKYWASKKWKFDWGDFGESKFKENITKIYKQLYESNEPKNCKTTCSTVEGNTNC